MEEHIQQYLDASNSCNNDSVTKESKRNILLQVIQRLYPKIPHASVLTVIEHVEQHSSAGGVTTAVLGPMEAGQFAATNATEAKQNHVQTEQDVANFIASVDAYFIQAAAVLLAKCNEIMHGLLTDPDAPIKYSDRALNWAIDLLTDVWPLQLSLAPVGTDQVLLNIDFSFRSYMQRPLNSKYLPSVLYAWFDELCMQWIQKLPTPLSENFEILYDTLRDHHHPEYHEWCMHDDYCVILFQQFTVTKVNTWQMVFDRNITNPTMLGRNWLRRFSTARLARMEWQNPELLAGLRRLLLYGIAIEVSMSWPSFWQALQEVFAIAVKSQEALFTTDCKQRWNDWLQQCTSIETQFMRLWIIEWLRTESDRIDGILERYLPHSNLKQVIAQILNLSTGMNISHQLWDVTQQLRAQQRDDRIKRGESAELIPAFLKAQSSKKQ